MSETERIAHALTDRTLPKSEWTHHAHLRAGLWHVVTLIESFLDGQDRSEPLDVIAERLIADYGDRDLPLTAILAGGVVFGACPAWLGCA